jgi:hypothetical protein
MFTQIGIFGLKICHLATLLGSDKMRHLVRTGWTEMGRFFLPPDFFD